MTQILNNLFFGSNYDGNKLELLQRNQIKAVILAGRGLSPTFPEEFVYKYFHLGDTKQSIIIQFFAEAFEFLDYYIKDLQENVMIYCYDGCSRSATFVMAYLMYSEEITAAQSFIFVSKRRKIDVNPAFIIQLLMFEEILNMYRQRKAQLGMPQKRTKYEMSKGDGGGGGKINPYDLINQVIPTYLPNYKALHTLNPNIKHKIYKAVEQSWCKFTGLCRKSRTFSFGKFKPTKPVVTLPPWMTEDMVQKNKKPKEPERIFVNPKIKEGQEPTGLGLDFEVLMANDYQYRKRMQEAEVRRKKEVENQMEEAYHRKICNPCGSQNKFKKKNEDNLNSIMTKCMVRGIYNQSMKLYSPRYAKCAMKSGSTSKRSCKGMFQ